MDINKYHEKALNLGTVDLVEKIRITAASVKLLYKGNESFFLTTVM